VLRIRKQEKAALAAAELRAYEEHVVSILRTHWPEAFAAQGEDAVRGFVHAWIPEAMAHGVRSEQEIAHVINVAFAVATDFGEDPRRVPWVREVLDDASLTETGKVYRLQVGLYAAYDARKR
jgi:hypothetical protein